MKYTTTAVLAMLVYEFSVSDHITGVELLTDTVSKVITVDAEPWFRFQ